MGRQPIIGEGHENRLEDFSPLVVWVKPAVEISRVKDDRHPVVNGLDGTVGIGRNQRARFDGLFALVASFPEASEGKGAFVFQLEAVGSLSIRAGRIRLR
jgi:hypothetical protein